MPPGFRSLPDELLVCFPIPETKPEPQPEARSCDAGVDDADPKALLRLGPWILQRILRTSGRFGRCGDKAEGRCGEKRGPCEVPPGALLTPLLGELERAVPTS